MTTVGGIDRANGGKPNELDVDGDGAAKVRGTLTLPSGAATAAKQDTGNAALADILAKIIAAPATAAKQDTGNTSLSSIDGKLPAVGPQAKSDSVSVTPPAPTASVTLKASATLPAAGAYEADPSAGNCVSIPSGSRRATITISYTRGDVGGYAAHKVFLSDGTLVGQVQAPDGTYNGVTGRVSTGASAIFYTLDVDVAGGSTKIGIASAEVGVVGTPGTVASTVTFG